MLCSILLNAAATSLLNSIEQSLSGLHTQIKKNERTEVS
jgi:hypothetical protein